MVYKIKKILSTFPLNSSLLSSFCPQCRQWSSTTWHRRTWWSVKVPTSRWSAAPPVTLNLMSCGGVKMDRSLTVMANQVRLYLSSLFVRDLSLFILTSFWVRLCPCGIWKLSVNVERTLCVNLGLCPLVGKIKLWMMNDDDCQWW